MTTTLTELLECIKPALPDTFSVVQTLLTLLASEKQESDCQRAIERIMK
jgi:hypothetical protein